MADDILDIPEGLLSTGDPVLESPFRPSDPLHELWRNATSEAEEALKRLNSKQLETCPDPDDRGLAWWCTLVVGKFDVWAKRGVEVVWNQVTLAEYDQWLTRYARSSLVAVRDFHTPEIPVSDLLRALRTRLIGRIEFWKAEARQKVNQAYSAPTEWECADSETGERRRAELGTKERQSDNSTSASEATASNEAKLTERRRSVDKYIEEVLTKTGQRITRTHIWKSAGYTSRTQFERWQRRAANASKAADQNFSRILREKPHLNPDRK